MRRGLFLASILALLVIVGPASAQIIIDFEQGSMVGGTISSAGVGTNIPVDILKVTIGATTTFYDLFGAGPSSATDANANGSALVNFNTATGAFTIVGGVCTTASSLTCPGTSTLVAAGTTLVNGTASSGTIVGFSSTTLDFREADTKSPLLLAALGLPSSTSFTLMDATFNYIGTSPFNVQSVDIQNVGVPEPTSILLLGTVLVGVTQLIRRRSRKA